MMLKRCLILLLLPVFVASCVVEEPPCPDIEIPDNPEGCNTYCDCADQEMVGRAFRFTRLEIDEPEAFAELLNTMWKDDIHRNLINILFVVDAADPGDLAAFDSISVRGGPAWRSPATPLFLEPGEGQSSEDVVDSYCLLQDDDGTDYSQTLEFLPYRGNQCVFKTWRDEGDPNSEEASLSFHTGPINDPVLCAPDVGPKNSIPIQNLKVRFGFNEDCTEIVDGYLEGCITIEDAEKIFMCILPSSTGDGYGCDHNPDCSGSWINFLQAVSIYNIFPTCITTSGGQGYRIQGFFNAVMVDDSQYNPTPSEDCTQN